MSAAEDELALHLRARRVKPWAREYRFHPSRKWRFDFAWPDDRLAVEVDGGVWVRGRHSRGAGQEADYVKLAASVLLGWRVLKVTPGQVKKGLAVAWIEQALGDDR